MILLTGGSGLLGRELIKLIDCYAPSSEVFDIRMAGLHFCTQREYSDHEERMRDIDLIVHCAAYTDVTKAETEKELCYQTNVLGTRNLASRGIPILYISTEYVFDGKKGNYEENDYPNPQNFYALTKLLGEYEARKSPNSVVLRCLFKPRPFEHMAACTDQLTTGDYVNVIAEQIAHAIRIFKRLPPTIHIGTCKKSTYELAKQTRPDVIPITVESIGLVRLPRDTSLNIKLWESLK